MTRDEVLTILREHLPEIQALGVSSLATVGSPSPIAFGSADAATIWTATYP